MIASFAATLRLHVTGTNPGMDSAYTPKLWAYAVRGLASPAPFGGSAVAQSLIDNGGQIIAGQSYDDGAPPPG